MNGPHLTSMMTDLSILFGDVKIDPGMWVDHFNPRELALELHRLAHVVLGPAVMGEYKLRQQKREGKHRGRTHDSSGHYSSAPGDQYTRVSTESLINSSAMKQRLVLSLLALSLGFSASLPSGAPEQNGMSAERLNRINGVMNKHVEEGDLAGASGLISRNGKIVFRATWGDYKPDTIVRMYSMTKAVTGVAAMILYEDGLYSMNDPLSKYLPEFGKTLVGKEGTDAAGKRIFYTVPLDHPILVKDMFRHTTGLDYAGPKDETGENVYRKIEMTGGAPLVSFDLAEATRRLASVPLNEQPGTAFHYGYSIDVLGRLVEVLSGTTLDKFFEEKIFKPLGMKDTAFFVPEEKWARLATLYAPIQP